MFVSAQPALFDRRDLQVQLVADPEKQKRLDAFYTDPLLADFCVAQLTDPRLLRSWLGLRSRVVEPSCGGGSFVEALLKRTPNVHAVDVDPDAAGLHIAPTHDVSDWLDWTPAEEDVVDWVVGNPPFGDAEAHLRHALSIARVGVAFLLRQGFVSSKERRPFFAEFPGAARVDLLERPSFTGDGKTDMYDYAFLVWLKGHQGPGKWVTASWERHRVVAGRP